MEERDRVAKTYVAIHMQICCFLMIAKFFLFCVLLNP